MSFEVGTRVAVMCRENPTHWCVGRVGTIIDFPEPERDCGTIPHKMHTVNLEIPSHGQHAVYILEHDLRELP